MEDTTELQKLTLQEEPTCSAAAAAFSFPPHRRRPLRSRTYHSLIQILSHCTTSEFPQPHTQVINQGDSAGVESEQVTEESGSIENDKAKSTNVLVLSHTYEKSEDALFQGSQDESKNHHDCQDGGVDDKQKTEGELVGMDLVMNGEQEAAQTVSFSVEDLFGDEQMDDFGPREQLEVNKDLSICDISEIPDSCFNMDMVVESSKEGEDIEENSSVFENTLPKESVDQLLVKEMEMELEKIISNSGSSAVDSFCSVSGDEDIEEGEIPGEDGVAGDLLNALSEDIISPGDKTSQLVHAPKDGAGGYWNHGESSIVNIANSDETRKMEESRETAIRMQDSNSQMCDGYMENRIFGPTRPCLENLPPSGNVIKENAAENKTYDASIEDGDVNKKKRKKGPLTKERRAKKKRKERIKRAEKNKKLGIKRLKLEPILKPKTVTYCRHYLQGRCHEGEKCKFSHDTVPLTKSKPCSYFARQSCMKGDDCPFDHQLSKYPCDNHTSKGFCSRGSDCLFSHEIPAIQSFSMTSSASKSEQHTKTKEQGSLMISKVIQPSVKLKSPLNNSNSNKNKRQEELLEPVRTAKQTPKGVSFLLHDGMSRGDTSNHKQDGSSPKTGDLTNEVHKGPVSVNKLKEVPVVETPKRPRGINFLSFAQSSLDDTRYKTFSNLLSSDYNEKGKSILGNFSEERQTQPLFGSGKTRTTNQNATDSVQSTIEKIQDTIKTPSVSLSGSWDQSAVERNASMSSSLKTSLFSNTPSLVQKALQSTLSFASKFESNIKLNPSLSVGKQ